MKTRTRLGALLCAMAMVLGLAACGGGGGTSGADVVTILRDAEAKIDTAQSVEFAMSIDVAMAATAADGTTEEMAATVGMNLATIIEPLKLKGDMNLNMAELGGEMGFSIYAVQEGDTLTAYLGMMGYWMGYTVDMSEFAALLEEETAAEIDIYADNASSAKKVAEETINDIATTKYTITITGASMEKIMVESGVIESMEGMGDMGLGMDVNWADMYTDMGDMIMNVWIDADGNPVRYEIDALDMANKIVAKAMAMTEEMYGTPIEEDVNFSKLLIVLDIIGIDNVEDFEIPADVINSAYFY